MKKLIAFVLVAACLGFGQTQIDLSKQKGPPPPLAPIVLSINTALGTTQVGKVILATAGVNGITITLPTAVGISGTIYTIKKVDSAIGVVTLATTASQSIDWDTSMLLVNQWQFVRVISDGVNWQIQDTTQ